MVNLTVGQVLFESPSEGYIHLPGDQSKNRQARRVPFSSAWCPRLVEILQAAVAGKSAHERIFMRGKQQNMPVKRFDKLWRVVAGMAGERGTAGARSAPDGVPQHAERRVHRNQNQGNLRLEKPIDVPALRPHQPGRSETGDPEAGRILGARARRPGGGRGAA